MKLPLSWLRQLVDLPPDVAAITAALVRAGFPVEHATSVGEGVDGVLVGEVLAVRPVEGSDKLSLVDVNTGTDTREIVCGASNYVVGDRVAVALPGAVLPGDFRITERKVMGVTSHGMMCSARELGLGDDHAGILLLDRGTELGRDAREVLGLPDVVLDLEVGPDRGYALSARGIARELATAFGLSYTDPAAIAAPAAGGGYPVRVEDPAGCPRYVARVVRGLDATAPSPLWLRRRLTLCGMRSVSLAVDVSNYVMLALGQPLHAFDLATVHGGIVVRRAGKGVTLTTLDDVPRALDPTDLVIADDSGAIAIAGVMGGASTEVSASTSDVLIEAANFAAVTIGRASKRHALSSEASRRFERGVDPDLPPAAAQLAVDLLVELGGAVADPTDTDVDHRQGRTTIRLAGEHPARLSGAEIDAATVRTHLVAIGADVTGDEPLEVIPPSWRPDLQLPVDLVEEVVRLVGYESLPSVPPPVPAGRGLTLAQRLRRRTARVLAAAGYAEAVTYPFLDPAVLGALRIAESDPRARPLRLANPLSEAESALRTTLLPGLLTALARNVGRGQSDVALYQLAPVVLPRGERVPAIRPDLSRRPTGDELAALARALPQQPLHAAVAITGHAERAGWWGPGRAAVWGDAVSALRDAAAELHVELTVETGTDATYHPGRCAALLLDGGVIGHAGELHPRVVAALGLPDRTCAGEIDLDAILAVAPELVPAPELSSYPAATVDVALVVDVVTPSAAVADALRAGAGPLLESLRLFDVYTGPPVPEGHRSLAYQLTFRSSEETLTDEVVLRHRDAAVAEAHRRTGAALRT